MSLKRSARLLAGAATSVALAAGGLAFTAPAAQAATTTAEATYTCGNPALQSLPAPLNELASFTVPATFTLENLPSVLTANVPVPAGTPISGVFQFPTSGGLAGVITGVAIALDSLLGPTPLNPVSTGFSDGAATLSGQLGAFTPTNELPLPIPQSFDASVVVPLLPAQLVTCTYNPGSLKGGVGTGGGVLVQKQGAKIKAKARDKVLDPGQKAVIKVKVKTSAGQKAVGKVLAKVKGQKAKVKKLKNGKVRFAFKRLAMGKNRIKVKFLGNAFTDKAKKKLVVRVVR